MKKLDIINALKQSGILPGESLMIHGNSAVASQLANVESNKKLGIFVKQIINYLGSEGTLVIPTFSYSFTQNEDFDVNMTKSKVGHFSEFCRTMPGVERSSHPIFSVVAIGKNKNLFKNSEINDCFGKNTCFDLLYKVDAKLMNLGCKFETTFAHYVEQKLKVNYRYFKYFEGLVSINSKKLYTKTRYFAGNRKIKYTLQLDCLKKKLLENNKLKIIPFGRIASYTVSARDFFYFANEIIKKNQYGIIKEGING